MDALYAEDGGNKTPTNLEEWGYLVVWFLSGLVPITSVNHPSKS